MKDRIYIAIDLKSFYASVECIERGLNPMTTNLVVADAQRSSKTICLAVSPSLKSHGIPGRPRLFEVVQKVREINALRQRCTASRQLSGASYDSVALKANPELAVDYITATPQMAHYLECSTKIYQIYLKYIAPEDIHIYSIDEVFIDITAYLPVYELSARELTTKIIMDVLNTTGITATAGIGTNLYLSKIAMDIEAKNMPADKNGVRIAELNEMSYRQALWAHRPLTDFWRIGRGYAKKLEAHGLFTMGDIARCSLGKPNELYNEQLLYKMFGVNAELLIDHAWGHEPCSMADIKAYRPASQSISSGQVLTGPYSFEKTRLIVREMTDLLVLDLVDRGLVTDQLVLTVGYDIENLKDPERLKRYKGEVTTDGYGRKIPKQAHGSINLGRHHSSTKQALEAVSELFDRIVDKDLLTRRVNVTANHVLPESSVKGEPHFEQLSLFSDTENAALDENEIDRERHRQQAIIEISKKFGKNSILKGMNFQEGATTRDRNRQIGGHRA